MLSKKQAEEFEAWGIDPPEFIPHENQIRRLNLTNWRMKGNQLIADSDYGQWVQNLPTDVLLKGTDEKGFPIFERIKA